MNDEDLKQKLQEIKNLEMELAQKKSEIRAQGVEQAQALIDSLEIDVTELRFKNSAKSAVRKMGGTVAPKYRGPNGETWSAAAVSRTGSPRSLNPDIRSKSI